MARLAEEGSGRCVLAVRAVPYMGRRIASLVKGLQLQHRDSTWKLTNRLGAGGFAEVWEVVTVSRQKVPLSLLLYSETLATFA